MTRDELIIQQLYETMDHMEPKQRRRRAIDHVLAARKAMRNQDRRAAMDRYGEAIQELKTSSNQEAHLAVEALQEHIYLIGRGE